MEKKTFKFSISTPTGHKYELDEVRMVTVDILEGRIGVMPGHAPLVSSLKVTELKITFANGDVELGAIKGGIFNVTPEEVVILTTNFCMEDEVKINHVEDELKNIEYQMQSDVKKAEAESLDNRYKYASLKQAMA